jgi:hypothetical protein
MYNLVVYFFNNIVIILFGVYMNLKTKTWSVGNGYWIIYIRKGLKRRFEKQFSNIKMFNEYYYKSKLVAISYIFKRDECLKDIRDWLNRVDK